MHIIIKKLRENIYNFKNKKLKTKLVTKRSHDITYYKIFHKINLLDWDSIKHLVCNFN